MKNPPRPCCPLSMLRPGEQGELIAFHCKRDVRRRLADLGLNCGECIRVISGDNSGSVILAFKQDARLALGRGMAHKIIVQPQDKVV